MSAIDDRVPGAIDLQDERVLRAQGVAGHLRAAWGRARGGDLGSIPVVVGLLVVWGVFQSLNPAFLSSANLVNLAMQCAAIGTISLGVVFLLLVGEIDLSVGSMSGLAGAVMAIFFVNHSVPLVLSLALALLAAALVGSIYGLLYVKFGVPSFVITLAGLLALLGLQLRLLGTVGSINVPYTSWLVAFAQSAFLPGWAAYLLVLLAGAALFAVGWSRRRGRRRAGLSAPSLIAVCVRPVLVVLFLGYVASVLNQTRGVGYMFVLFIALVVVADYALRRTAWGRSLRAIGGNPEAARRAGIKVNRVYVSAFVACTTLAAVGGILSAARLAAVNQGSGTGDVNLNAIAAAVIGGTSLFGGRGSAWSAVVGVVVIMSISSGLTLLNLDSSIRFMMTAAVLLLAVIVDSLSRRSRKSHGRS